MQKDCVVCSGRFTAKRAAALYCSDRCRKRAQRAPAAAPARREGAAVITLTPSASPGAQLARAMEEGASRAYGTEPHPPQPDGLAAATERELQAAGRLDTSLGQAAMFLAEVLEKGGSGQTGSSIASLIREHRTTLAKAVEGATKTETPLQRLRAARAARQVGA